MTVADDWLAELRRFAWPRVIERGWSGADDDRVIEEEREAMQPRLDTTSDFAELVLPRWEVAELERRRIVERTVWCRADATSVQFGHKAGLAPHQHREARKRIGAGETHRSVTHSYNVSQTTILRRAA